MGNMPEGLLDVLDERIHSIRNRGALHKDEAAKLMEGLPTDFTPHREYLTRAEVQNMLLDARLVLMAEEREEYGKLIPEGLDDLVGVDLSAG